jgi:hypothetical protein
MMDLFLRHNEVGVLDLDMSSGDIALCPTEYYCIAQTITIRLKTLAGEWFLDTSVGIPYLTEILGHKLNERFLRHLIMPEIQTIPGVLEITNFKAEEKADRGLTISFAVLMSDGAKRSFKESMGV